MICVSAYEVSVSIVVVVTGINGVGEQKAADGWLLIGLERAIALSLVDQSARASSGDDVGDSVTIDIGKVGIRRDISDIRHRRLEGSVPLTEENEEAVANL